MKHKSTDIISELDHENLALLEIENLEFTKENEENIRMKFEERAHMHQLKKNRRSIRQMVAFACSLALVVVLINTNSAFAQTLYSVPVVGVLAKLVTIDHMSFTSDNREVDIEIVKIVGIEDEELQNAINEMLLAQGTALYNESVEKKLEENGREAIYQNYDVKRNDKDMLSFRVVTTEIQGSGYETAKYYNVDVENSKIITLKSLFGEGFDYRTVIDNEIVRLMEIAKETEEKPFFIEDFKGVNDETGFYINENGHLVIVFNEYEVAPGYMGMPEFEIDTAVFINEGFEVQYLGE